MDEHAVRRISWLRADPFVSGILRGLLRRRSLRDEGSLAGHREGTAAADFQELVQTSLSVRVRDISLRPGERIAARPGTNMIHPPHLKAQSATDRDRFRHQFAAD